MRLRTPLGLIVGIALANYAAGTSTALAQGAQRSATPGPAAKRAVQPANRPEAAEAREAEAKLEKLLTAWETQSSRLKTLDVDIERIDTERGFPNDAIHYFGRAILQAPNRAFLNLKKVVVDEKTKKPVSIPHDQIRCTGDEVWHYKPETRQIFIFPLGNDQRQRALEEGPLRFLFNMRKADAKARYQMDLIKQEPSFYVISVLPLQQVDQESFSKAFLQLDAKYLLPTRIVLISPNGKNTEDYKLTNHKANEPVMPQNFEGVVVKGWKVTRNPGEGVAPAQTKARPARPGPRMGANAPDRR